MNKLLTLSLILISLSCFGQKKDTLSSPVINPIQTERLNVAYAELNEKQKAVNDLLELIFGVKMEDVEWWGFDQKKGKFQFILKPKKK